MSSVACLPCNRTHSHLRFKVLCASIRVTKLEISSSNGKYLFFCSHFILLEKCVRNLFCLPISLFAFQMHTICVRWTREIFLFHFSILRVFYIFANEMLLGNCAHFISTLFFIGFPLCVRLIKIMCGLWTEQWRLVLLELCVIVLKQNMYKCFSLAWWMSFCHRYCQL